MIKSNCHTHTYYCDGKSSPEEMVKSAVRLNFISLGFSVHSPMYFENDWAIKEEKMSEYYNEIERLRKNYKNKIEIYNGIELDGDMINLSSYKFDYTIASVHQLHCGDKIYSIDCSAQELKTCVETEFGGSWLSMAKQYYSSVCDFVCKTKPDVVGHFDLIEKFNDNKEMFDDESDEYKLLVCLYLDRICYACPDVIFEVNTGAMYRCGNKLPYPAPFIMKRLKENNMKITITSDSHSVDSLDYAFDETVKYCKEYGFNEAYILKDGTFQKVNI